MTIADCKNASPLSMEYVEGMLNKGRSAPPAVVRSLVGHIVRKDMPFNAADAAAKATPKEPKSAKESD